MNFHVKYLYRIGVLLSLAVSHLPAQSRITRDEALQHFFPNAKIERKTAFLTEAQVSMIQQKGKAKVDSKVVTYYVASVGGSVVGTSFFETRTIRTMPATYVVIVRPDLTVRLVEILAFYEPEDYRPSKRWLGQFDGTSTEDDLFLKRGLQNISGATMTARVLSDAVRRILATFEEVIAPEMVVQ